MNTQTVQQLNRLNAKFYQSVGKHFDETRQQYWQGWEQVLGQTTDLPDEINVLDIGCGNGRFTSFLANKGLHFKYTGVDNNTFLINQAKERYNFPHNSFLELDFVQNNLSVLNSSRFDLIVLFGVMHHIPSQKKRTQLLQSLNPKLNSKGYLVFTLWDFLSEPHLAARTTDWSKYPEIDTAELETGDYLLDWQRGSRAVRYCHNFNDFEKNALLDSLSLQKVAEFRADGKNGQSNIYIIAQKII